MDDLPHILVVDDDSRLRSLLHQYLSQNGFRVTGVADANEARQRLLALTFDLIVLDVMMPGETGLELTADLRRTERVPILLLTAMGEPEDRIAGLESGADDYLPKPFEPRELLLRIRTILRRVAEAPGPGGGDDPVRFGEFHFDLRQDQLYRGPLRIRLTDAETGLLRAFVERAGTPLSREDLLECNAVNGNVRTVDVQITRLRRKLEQDPKFPRYLQTVRGLGYVLKADA
ncbi:MAG: response regulator [Proteobacteria bacterium]|nr:response regulator [Pseudomonadota bacterium]